MTRSDEIFAETRTQISRGTDRVFFWLFIAQWLFAIALAVILTPYEWSGFERVVHFHVKLALVGGGLLNALPLALLVIRPGWGPTRYLVAVVQMLWSAMLIMVTGGRIETHFHIFGSLAFLAFYRDWRVLAVATLAVLGDHAARGLFWPDSVYGVANPEWWRFLEHGGWVAFEDLVLMLGCARSVREMHCAAVREARLEATKTEVENAVERRTLELKDALERYRALVETTAAIPWEYERIARRVRYVGPQATQLFDCTLADLADPAFLIGSLHPDDHARVHDELWKFVAAGCPSGYAVECRFVTKSRRIAYARTYLSSTDARVVRGVTLDITEQRLLEIELQQAQKLESVGRLAAGVAHEINTPVQFVSDSVRFVREGVSELRNVIDLHHQLTSAVLAGAPASELARKVFAADAEIDLGYLFSEFPVALDRALDGLGRVAQIVRSMKTFARADGSEMTATDLNAAIESTLTIARNEYKYVADLVTEYGALPPVMCHMGELNQVVLNLVVNAAHAIAEREAGGEKRGTISVATRVDGDCALVSIGDTGTGIPADLRDRIFEPFFTTKPVGRGTGQGLAISRSVVVDKHGGTLTFDSEIGRGTTFHIRIPIAPRPAAQAA